jgi:hypothetical protein
VCRGLVVPQLLFAAAVPCSGWLLKDVVTLLLQLMLESPDAQAAETGALQMGAAFAFAIYCFREYKKLSFGKQIKKNCSTYSLLCSRALG